MVSEDHVKNFDLLEKLKGLTLNVDHKTYNLILPQIRYLPALKSLNFVGNFTVPFSMQPPSRNSTGQTAFPSLEHLQWGVRHVSSAQVTVFKQLSQLKSLVLTVASKAEVIPFKLLVNLVKLKVACHNWLNADLSFL